MQRQSPDATSIRVRKLMTEDPIVVEADVDVERVLAIMRQADIRHVPVVDDSGLMGMVSDRDLAFIHGLPGVVDKLEDEDIEAVMEAPISLVLKSRFLVERDVVSIDADESLEVAVDIFVADKLGALPVVDEEGGVVGILSSVDVLRWVRNDVLD